jgi:hypothetical protein
VQLFYNKIILMLFNFVLFLFIVLEVLQMERKQIFIIVVITGSRFTIERYGGLRRQFYTCDYFVLFQQLYLSLHHF